MTTRTIDARYLAKGMQILEVDGVPVAGTIVVGNVRAAFALPWAPKRVNVWDVFGWPGGPPTLTLPAGARVKVRTVA